MDAETLRVVAREMLERADGERDLAGRHQAGCGVLHTVRAVLLREVAADLHTRAINTEWEAGGGRHVG